jgi:phenylalanyl-tRNA synthetase beta chain
MRERLRRSGLRPLQPIVDVTNYVLLELGQPLHAFDLNRLDKGIQVRLAREGEKLVLLDEREVTLDPDVLLIADHSNPVAMAGIMGGLDSAVTMDTRSILLESAFFNPLAIAGRGRRHGLHTDASHRFERGVEPGLQRRAIQRATELIVQIAGGRPGPVVEARSDRHMPLRKPIELRRERLTTLLGLSVPDQRVLEILQGLGLSVTVVPGGWAAVPPAHRFDLEIEADLIEEVARLVGYDEIPEVPLQSAANLVAASESRVEVDQIRDRMAALGYQEAITYSFVDPELQSVLFPDVVPLALSNPISADLSVMRVSLWPGLLATLKENASRQQERVRIFECGVKFFPEGNEFKEINSLAGLITGDRWPEQWGSPKQAADLFDIKSDMESILRLGRNFAGISLRAEPLSALHPGQSARVLCGEDTIGWLGALHPEIQRQMGFKSPVFLFELNIEGVTASIVPSYEPISRFPRVRRDLAFVVPEAAPADALLACARQAAGSLLAECRLFDVYQGKGIDSGLKSVALGLILQESSRTLTDQEADDVVANVGRALRTEFAASLRE